jgi:hypothetical protein
MLSQKTIRRKQKAFMKKYVAPHCKVDDVFYLNSLQIQTVYGILNLSNKLPEAHKISFYVTGIMNFHRLRENAREAFTMSSFSHEDNYGFNLYVWDDKEHERLKKLSMFLEISGGIWPHDV